MCVCMCLALSTLYIQLHLSVTAHTDQNPGDSGQEWEHREQSNILAHMAPEEDSASVGQLGLSVPVQWFPAPSNRLLSMASCWAGPAFECPQGRPEA